MLVDRVFQHEKDALKFTVRSSLKKTNTIRFLTTLALKKGKLTISPLMIYHLISEGPKKPNLTALS